MEQPQRKHSEKNTKNKFGKVDCSGIRKKKIPELKYDITLIQVVCQENEEGRF